MNNEWDGDLHYNDTKFIEVSIRMPQQVFKNNKNDFSLKFRQIGNRENEEAVIFIPSIYETEASFYRMVPLFEQEKIRLVIVTTFNHSSFEMLIQTFDQFLRYLKIKKMHLIGCDFGGFVCLQIQNTVNFAAEVLSLSLINAYTQNTHFIPRGITAFTLFGSLVARNSLKEELEQNGMLFSPNESTKFIIHELSHLDMSEIKNRIDLRMAITPPLYLHLHPNAIMSIEPLDREIQLASSYLPSLTLGGVKQALMKNGGDWPHLSSPEDLFTYILVHIKKWSKKDEIPKTENE